MADSSGSDAEKTEEPSQHRIDESRKKGEVASSKELTSVLVLASSVFTLALSMVYIYEELELLVQWLYSLDAHTAYTVKSLKTITTKVAMTAFSCTAPVFLVAFMVSIISNVAQFGILFSPDVLQLKWERVDPIKGVKKLFSMRSVVEALKGVFKFTVVISVVYYVLGEDMGSYQGFLHSEFIQSFLYGKDLILRLAISMILGLGVIAIFDFAYQKYSYHKKMMMSKDEAKKEHKEKEGNPEVKQRIRAIQREAAQRRMMLDVPTADVIVTNPTHISIALKYDPETMISPQVIAKGADHIALRIRKMAKEHDIPIVENVPLARSIYKTVKVGNGVPRGIYKAVAEILSFVYKLKKSKKALL